MTISFSTASALILPMMAVNTAGTQRAELRIGWTMAMRSSGLCQNRSLSNNGSSELYSQEKFCKKLSTGGILKAEGFGDGLLTSIEYRNKEILEIPFQTPYHILYSFLR